MNKRSIGFSFCRTRIYSAIVIFVVLGALCVILALALSLLADTPSKEKGTEIAWLWEEKSALLPAFLFIAPTETGQQRHTETQTTKRKNQFMCYTFRSSCRWLTVFLYTLGHTDTIHPVIVSVVDFCLLLFFFNQSTEKFNSFECTKSEIISSRHNFVSFPSRPSQRRCSSLPNPKMFVILSCKRQSRV